MARDGIRLTSSSKQELDGLDKIKKTFQNGINHGLTRVGKLVVKFATAGIKNPPKTGVQRSGRNRASSPGEFPADQTGELRRSINFKVQGGSKKMIFGAKKLHGKFLEKGTRSIEPRPFIDRTVKDTNKQVEIILEKALDEEIKRKL